MPDSDMYPICHGPSRGQQGVRNDQESEHVAFADTAAARKGGASGRLHICGRTAFGGLPTDGGFFLVAAVSANATSSALSGHDSGHGISDTYHRSG